MAYLDRFMTGFRDELQKIAHDLTQSERTDFAQPKKEEEGHKGKYPIPDKKHYGIALGFAKMHHDSGALAAIHAKGKKMGYTKESNGDEAYTNPEIGLDKSAGFMKNTLVGLGMLGATAGGAKAMKTIAKPAAHMAATTPRMIGASSSQMADLAREGVKFAGALTSANAVPRWFLAGSALGGLSGASSGFSPKYEFNDQTGQADRRSTLNRLGRGLVGGAVGTVAGGALGYRIGHMVNGANAHLAGKAAKTVAKKILN